MTSTCKMGKHRTVQQRDESAVFVFTRASTQRRSSSDKESLSTLTQSTGDDFTISKSLKEMTYADESLLQQYAQLERHVDKAIEAFRGAPDPMDAADAILRAHISDTLVLQTIQVFDNKDRDSNSSSENKKMLSAIQLMTELLLERTSAQMPLLERNSVKQESANENQNHTILTRLEFHSNDADNNTQYPSPLYKNVNPCNTAQNDSSHVTPTQSITDTNDEEEVILPVDSQRRQHQLLEHLHRTITNPNIISSPTTSFSIASKGGSHTGHSGFKDTTDFIGSDSNFAKGTHINAKIHSLLSLVHLGQDDDEQSSQEKNPEAMFSANSLQRANDETTYSWRNQPQEKHASILSQVERAQSKSPQTTTNGILALLPMSQLSQLVDTSKDNAKNDHKTNFVGVPIVFSCSASFAFLAAPTTEAASPMSVPREITLGFTANEVSKHDNDDGVVRSDDFGPHIHDGTSRRIHHELFLTGRVRWKTMLKSTPQTQDGSNQLGRCPFFANFCLDKGKKTEISTRHLSSHGKQGILQYSRCYQKEASDPPSIVWVQK